MAKLTIEIDMEDPQEMWDALYRRIEQFGDEGEAKDKKPLAAPSGPTTYDLLLEPEHSNSELGDFFPVFSGTE